MINTVQNIDCLIGMQAIPDKSIDMILCDLPYGTTACKWDVVIPFEPLWKQYERIIKDNGAIVLTASQPFTSALVMSNPKLFKYEVIWEKGQATNPMMADKQIMKRHENILCFSKKQTVFNPQMEVGKPYKGFNSSNGKNIGEVYGSLRSIHNENSGTRNPTSIIKYSREYGLHPTQKPAALFEYLIKTYTNEGETVLDNCMGSGTTAIACINTNRNYIGFEKEEKYYDIILKRIKQHTPQLKLIA